MSEIPSRIDINVAPDTLARIVSATKCSQRMPIEELSRFELPSHEDPEAKTDIVSYLRAALSRRIKTILERFHRFYFPTRFCVIVSEARSAIEDVLDRHEIDFIDIQDGTEETSRPNMRHGTLSGRIANRILETEDPALRTALENLPIFAKAGLFEELRAKVQRKIEDDIAGYREATSKQKSRLEEREEELQEIGVFSPHEKATKTERRAETVQAARDLSAEISRILGKISRREIWQSQTACYAMKNILIPEGRTSDELLPMWLSEIERFFTNGQGVNILHAYGMELNREIPGNPPEDVLRNIFSREVAFHVSPTEAEAVIKRAARTRSNIALALGIIGGLSVIGFFSGDIAAALLKRRDRNSGGEFCSIETAEGLNVLSDVQKEVASTILSTRRVGLEDPFPENPSKAAFYLYMSQELPAVVSEIDFIYTLPAIQLRFNGRQDGRRIRFIGPAFFPQLGQTLKDVLLSGEGKSEMEIGFQKDANGVPLESSMNIDVAVELAE